MIEIDCSNDPRIQEFTKIRDRSLHENGFILAETEKLFLQFKAQALRFEKILCTPHFAEKHHLQGDHVFLASKDILESIAGFKIHFEVLFLADKPNDYQLSDLDNHIVLLNGLSSPENVGSIVRSAAAFQINSIISDEKTCSPFLRRCIRVSMGNIFSMKVHHSTNIMNTLIQLRQLGYCIISTANLQDSIDVKQFKFPLKSVLIIGSEGHGVDSQILKFSDKVLKIRINDQVAHLNAGNAAAIFLSHMTLIK